MSHLLRPPSEKTFNIADSLAGIPRCIHILEAALVDVLNDYHSESLRHVARDMTRTLSAGCPQCGFHGSHAVLRKIEALLRVPPKAAPELQRQIADKLIELVGMLKAQAQAKGSDKQE
jgi:hypothetical protein